MSKYYVIDEIGNKYESMTKSEILQSIGAGGERENVFTGDLIYDNERIDYTYTGEKPTDDIILKLLDAGLKPEDTHLTDIEIMTIAALNDFTIHYYYTDGELYVSNGNDNSIKFFKEGIGVMTLYPNSREVSYYMKSSKKMNDVRYCQSKQEFDDIVKDEDTTYIVEDENYTVDYALEAEHAKKANNANYATNANTAIVSRVPQAITGDTKFYPVDQDADYIGLAEENFTLDEVFAKDESSEDVKYLPKVKNATNADYAINANHCDTANDANYAVAADNLYVEQKYSDSVKIVNSNTVTSSQILGVLDGVNKPAIIHFQLLVQVYDSTGEMTGNVIHSESMFYDGATLISSKLCPVMILNAQNSTYAETRHICIQYARTGNSLYAYLCDSGQYPLSVYLNNVYVSTLELA